MSYDGTVKPVAVCMDCGELLKHLPTGTYCHQHKAFVEANWVTDLRWRPDGNAVAPKGLGAPGQYRKVGK